MNNHNGKCAFCMTIVPKEASTCTGCGAMWGVQMKSGHTIHISKYKSQMKGQLLAPVIYLIIIAAIYFFALPNADHDLWKWVSLGGIAFLGFCTLISIPIALKSLFGFLFTKEAWWKSTI
ncbi:hypothetical protein [Thalassotalea sp. PLHSN55]|uniref:hypothetical protein n=1 Tax=Thalassotalea sp. PLHSN55 TaxID=3435888 RepID=UPI003F845064